MTRNNKRLIIILVYLGIFSLFFFLVFLFTHPKPTCNDGKKNQSEKGIDCGGPCRPCKKEMKAKDLTVLEKHIVYGGENGKIDVVIKINNPNNDYGAEYFDYDIFLEDENGNSLGKRAGHSFILPKENKYIIEQNFKSDVKPQNIRFEMKNVKWIKFSSYQSEPNLEIYNKNFYEERNGNKLTALLKNESYFDFNSIEIDIIVKDKKGEVIALGKNEMRTVHSQEQRDFTMIWPYKLQGDVADVEIRAEANVYDSNNFIKKYLPTQKFQEY